MQKNMHASARGNESRYVIVLTFLIISMSPQNLKNNSLWYFPNFIESLWDLILVDTFLLLGILLMSDISLPSYFLYHLFLLTFV